MKDFKLQQIQEHQDGGVIFPLKFENVEDMGVHVGQLISLLHLITEQGDSLNHLNAEDILSPLRGVTTILKQMYCDGLDWNLHTIDQLRAMQKK
jgi:hypothetical protein